MRLLQDDDMKEIEVANMARLQTVGELEDEFIKKFCMTILKLQEMVNDYDHNKKKTIRSLIKKESKHVAWSKVVSKHYNPFNNQSTPLAFGSIAAAAYSGANASQFPHQGAYFSLMEQQLELKRENQEKFGSYMRKILEECKNMLNNKMKEVMRHNTNLNQPTNNDKFKNYKCFQCKQLGHIVKTCPMDSKIKNTDAKKETKKRMEGIIAPKPTVLITYPETVHFSTTCMLKGTNLAGWDEVWYVSNKIDRHVCYKLDTFCNIKEEFSVTKLENHRKFLFSYGLGKILIEANGNSHIIPGVYYAPEVTLNILSQEQLEKQGFPVTYDGNRCSLSLMFKDKEIKRFDEDRLMRMHNHYMQEYFESISKEGEGLEQDTINIKGNLYTTKVQSFTDFVAFLNLVKLDVVVSQEWDYFRKRFNMVVKWFFNHYLNRSLPGNIPPIINGVEIHLFDLYKIMENLGGYLSVHFSQEFDMVEEIMGLSKGKGEEIRKCYMNFLEILTSHFKTARAPRQGNMDTMLEPTRRDRECLGYHQGKIGEDDAQWRRPASIIYKFCQ
nr:ARID DNA-binding domain-containing protein [Tanacetum cinerariifolium]